MGLNVFTLFVGFGIGSLGFGALMCTCRRHYPGAASERIASLILSRRISLPR